MAIGTATITPGVVSRVAGSIGGNLVSAVTNTDAAGAALLALSESIDGATPFWVRRFNSGHSITPGLCELWSMSELRLGASNVEVMRFAAGGNVGIGTDSPNAKLQVAGSLCATGPSRFGQYTLSTLPSASAYNGYTITVSNAAGGPALCLSNGSSWINIRTNAPVN